MSTIKVNAITDASGGNTATINSMTPTADSLQGFRNRIINGDMRIDQRNAGASVTLTSAGVYTVDRFIGFEDTDGVMTAQQDSSAPPGFNNSLKLTTTTADASLSALQFSIFQHRIEGTNVADLGWGTANAKTVTLSFWVRSSLTGTFGGALLNSAQNRSYPFTYSISVADTWEQKTVIVAGDTSGTWLTTTGIGLNVCFGLGVGSTISGTAGSWSGSTYYSATGAVSVIGTLNATFYITGFQLEVGSVATPFERRPYGTELMLCQRYFQTVGAGSASNSIPFATGQAYSTTAALYPYTLTPNMRATPTMSYSGVNTWNSTGSSAGSPTFAIETGSSERSLRIVASSATGLVAGNATGMHLTVSSSFCTFSSEL